MSVRKRRNGTPLLAAALLLAGPLGCQPGTPKEAVESEISVLNSKADYLNVRVGKAEKSLEALAKAVEETDKNSRAGRADLSVAVEDLRTELKTLGGEMGVLRHNLDEYSRTNQKVKEDFDARLTEMDQRVADLALAAETPKTAPRGRAAPDDETTRYQKTLALLQKKKEYDGAIEGFRDFLRDFPRSKLAPNAQYWIGEAYYAKKDYARAISEYQVVVDKYPKGEKLCDALLKQGYAFDELREPDKAKLFLGEVRDRCPRSPAAEKAAERLAQPQP